MNTLLSSAKSKGINPKTVFQTLFILPFINANATGHDAVLYATTNTTNRTGETAKALRTNASSGSYKEIADDANFDFGTNDFTVSIWVRKEVAPTATVNVIAVGKWNNTSQVSTNEWCLNIARSSGSTRPPQFQIAIGGTLYTAQGTATLSNTWHHLVGVREGSNIKFYLNGTLVATTAVGTGAINNVAGRDIRLGRSEGSLRTRAGFDEFLIYQRALSAGEISNLYTSTCEDLEGMLGEEGIAGGEYRYGFNGKEKDDEIKGKGNGVNFKYRMHDPRLGRFFAVDPLTKRYPYFSSYQFSGNMPIQFREREGLEPAMTALNFNHNLVFGNNQTTNAVNNHPSFRKNVNWNAYSVQSIYDVEIKVAEIKSMGANIQNIYLQNHGLPGSMMLDPGMNEPGRFGSPVRVDANFINKYMSMKGESAENREAFMSTLNPFELEKISLISALDNVISKIEDGGTLIVGGCFAGECDANLGFGDMNDALKNLSGGRINIVMNQDGTRVNRAGEQFLDQTLTTSRNFQDGWVENGNPTGLDLQLNSNQEEVKENVDPR